MNDRSVMECVDRSLRDLLKNDHVFGVFRFCGAATGNRRSL